MTGAVRWFKTCCEEPVSNTVYYIVKGGVTGAVRWFKTCCEEPVSNTVYYIVNRCS